MKTQRLIIGAAALALLTLQPARAGLLLTDDFESGTLSPSRWANNFSGNLTADPLASGHGLVLHFASFGSGGDLFSQLFAYTDQVNIQFDFLQTGTTNSGAYVGTDHQTFPEGDEQWILNTGGGGAYHNLDFLSAGAWHHVNLTLDIFDTFSAGSFSLKFEQSNAGAGVGNAYFDNIQVQDNVPEPGTLTCLLIGLGGLAAARFLRNSFR